ncbi:MAG: hypothetical protein ABIR53_06155 [Paraperlucidibaca sp.]
MNIQRKWMAVLSLGLLLSVQSASNAADFSPSTEPEPCVVRDSAGDLLGWADYPHCLIELRALSTVRWLDDWLGHPEMDERASLALRAISEFTIDDKGDLTAALRLRAQVALPRLSKRLSLVFEDESKEANSLRSIPTVNESALALRWLLVNLERMRIETDAGVRSGPDVFVRGRFASSYAISTDDQVRFTQSLRYSAKEKVRAINTLDYNHALQDDSVFTLYHQLDYQQDNAIDGTFWSRGAVFSRALSTSSSAAFGAGQEGVSDGWQERSRHVWLRYRQQFLREWLFYEIEPRLTQTRERDWDTLPSLTLRLEVHFGHHRRDKAPRVAFLPNVDER